MTISTFVSRHCGIAPPTLHILQKTVWLAAYLAIHDMHEWASLLSSPHSAKSAKRCRDRGEG